eukprot:3796811-Prymnesium_polylepis.1
MTANSSLKDTFLGDAVAPPPRQHGPGRTAASLTELSLATEARGDGGAAECDAAASAGTLADTAGAAGSE